MADRPADVARRSTEPPQREPDGSAIPARLRIVGWIVLATSLGLLAVVLTIRSALLTDADRAANSDVVQEVDEFRTFAARGLDPTTGRPFATAERLLSLHLEREYPGQSEVLFAYVRGADQPVLAQAVRDRFGLIGDRVVLEELAADPATSGTRRTAAGEFRWGKAVVAPSGTSQGGAFLVAHFTGPARAEVDRIVRLVLLVCLGGLLLTAAIAYAVAGQILAPVRTVRRAASRITRADLGQRIDVRGRDDVAALALTFNAMLDRLQGAFTAQQRFSAAAGRHLRAPLSVLADPLVGPGSRAAAVEQAGAVLDDLEVLAASEAPGFLAPVPVDLQVLGDQLAGDVRALSRRPWVVEASATGTVLLDDVRVRQAVRRLALNALQQPSGGAPLRLGLELDRTQDGSSLEVWVADDGPGLTPERAASVLDRYAEADPVTDPATDTDIDTAADVARAGLGLAVVRAVADAHDGSAWVETEPDRGARFGLRLPVHRPPADAPPTAVPDPAAVPGPAADPGTAGLVPAPAGAPS